MRWKSMENKIYLTPKQTRHLIDYIQRDLIDLCMASSDLPNDIDIAFEEIFYNAIDTYNGRVDEDYKLPFVEDFDDT
tara:strand:- start:88 stop:318 length:231 start_codon:yes stop_codon:yes gene_type:complete